ncbi:hypothetical protein LCGC14_2457380 [marine sediment metagenome]|uniref:Uncharacterized protein n=1 Tax=marine sediment metagenome TaxID=412755 RepID=A0A0F9E871_9ZZZZ
MTGKYYKKCGICGESIHLGHWCTDCVGKADPWDELMNKLLMFRKLSKMWKLISKAFDDARKI